MRAEIARVVFPIIHRALQTQRRLADGHQLPCDVELAAFQAALLTEREASAIPKFRADGQRGGMRFLGIRYALACWLDETLGRQPLWLDRWPAHALESALFGTQAGVKGFWEQAAMVLTRSEIDACEVMMLCVHLGGRETWRDERAAAWVQSVKAKLAEGLSCPWPAPPALEVAPQAPPLRQREKLHRALWAVGVPLSVLAPLAAWVVARRVGW